MGCNQPIDLEEFNSNLRSLSVCSDADILLSNACRSIIEELICDTTRLISASIRDVSMGEISIFSTSMLTIASSASASASASASMLTIASSNRVFSSIFKDASCCLIDSKIVIN